MKELPQPVDDDEEDSDSEKSLAVKRILNLEKNFDGYDLDILKDYGYPRPNDFFEINPKDLEENLEELKYEIKQLTGEINGRNRTINPSQSYIEKTENIKNEKGTIIKYRNTLRDYLSSIKYKIGKGIVYFNNPHQLLNRLELLGGSILAGTNGVIPEFSQIAHLLNQMKVITKKQLNELLKTYITNR